MPLPPPPGVFVGSGGAPPPTFSPAHLPAFAHPGGGAGVPSHAQQQPPAPRPAPAPAPARTPSAPPPPSLSLLLNAGPHPTGLYQIGPTSGNASNNKGGATLALFLDRPLDRPECPQLIPGESVRGVIKLTTRETSKLAWVRLWWWGQEHVRWTEQRDKSTVTFEDTEKLVDEEDQLLFSVGRKKGERAPPSALIELLPGAHSYPFTFTLPLEAASLPPAFPSAPCGSVTYGLTAAVKIDGRFFDSTLEVNSPLPFLVAPEVESDGHRPGVPCSSMSGEEISLPTFCCCGHAGAARGFLRLASSVHVAAPRTTQELPVEYSVCVGEAASPAPLRHVTLKVVRWAGYTARGTFSGGRTTSAETLFERRFDIAEDVAAHAAAGVYVLSNPLLPVPDTFPPVLELLRAPALLDVPTFEGTLIKLSYKVHLSFCAGSCAHDKEVELPFSVIPAGSAVGGGEGGGGGDAEEGSAPPGTRPQQPQVQQNVREQYNDDPEAMGDPRG
jgi:hypothetical protein